MHVHTFTVHAIVRVCVFNVYICENPHYMYIRITSAYVQRSSGWANAILLLIALPFADFLRCLLVQCLHFQKSSKP